jgi:LPXTG-site transpeptidase (sortase) family protein
VFTDLEKLKVGDSILININNKQYTYLVRETKIINRGADVPTINDADTKNILTLISCWPPGKDYQRIAVIAQLQAN